MTPTIEDVTIADLEVLYVEGDENSCIGRVVPVEEDAAVVVSAIEDVGGVVEVVVDDEDIKAVDVDVVEDVARVAPDDEKVDVAWADDDGVVVIVPEDVDHDVVLVGDENVVVVGPEDVVVDVKETEELGASDDEEAEIGLPADEDVAVPVPDAQDVERGTEVLAVSDNVEEAVPVAPEDGSADNVVLVMVSDDEEAEELVVSDAGPAELVKDGLVVSEAGLDVGVTSVEVVVVVVVLAGVVQIPPESGVAPGGQTQLFPDEAGTLSAVHTQLPLLSAAVPDGQVHPPAPSSILSAGHTQTPVVVSRDLGGTQLTKQIFCQSV
ncbi:hypothetical protein HDU87_003398 [Geranomyces variabilis]|uniref:Uncharacterized protein n=1 Tax=Geranomyces variabilis TaxID=109894 RepID=A0AAD5XSK0_9FUNG|nr:hypothetical protein HDU87_003398 [Geranomyces variabilis]